MQRIATISANLITLFFDSFIRNAATSPVSIPITNGSKTIPAIAMGEDAQAPPAPLTIEMTVKKTITPMISSIAANCIIIYIYITQEKIF